jgi:2-dehydropantoate 2-reductase
MSGADKPRSAAIVGAGAIGSWLADALDRAGWRVSVVARGATLAALRDQGLRVVRHGERRVSHPAAGSAGQCGAQDYVFLTVKAQSLPALAPELAPLFGPSTSIVSGTNGIPWWFFEDFHGPLENQVLEAVDPGGVQARCFGRGWALGAVVHASVRVQAPAEIEVVAVDRLLVGEPGGTVSTRVAEVVDALCAGGINALPSAHIRDEVWAKLWGNMNMNPLSALARCGTARLLADAEVRTLCIRMMEEMQECGRILNLNSAMTAGQRIEVTRRLGDFRTSMLADVEAGRPLELEPQLGAVVEIAGRLAVPTPYCRAILGLTRLLSAPPA